MKQTHYFTLNFTGFTTAASEEQSYLRLIEDGRVFYTDKRYFKDSSLFDRLQVGQPLHIGTRQLQDGSYWIHWLSDGSALLEPSLQPLKGAWLFGVLALCVAVGMIANGLFFGLFMFALLVMLFLRIHPTGFAWIAHNFSLTQADLISKMNQARQGDFSFFQILNSAHSIDEINRLPLDKNLSLPEHIALEEGVIMNSYFRMWEYRPSRRYATAEGVCFQLATSTLYFPAQLTWLTNLFATHPNIYRHHPPFLADGDWVITARQHGHNGLQALYNVSDGSTYLKSSQFSLGNPQMAFIYKLAYGFVLLIVLFTLSMHLHDLLSAPVNWKFITSLMIMAMPINLLLIIIELIGLVSRRLSRRVKGRIKVHQIILAYARRNGSRITPRELI
ncbi:hypothetical protein ACFFOE_002823 [Klebsiella aerogenes]